MKMADGLATINIDQLNHAVTNAVNLARLADLSSNVSPLTTSSATIHTHPSTSTVKNPKQRTAIVSQPSEISKASCDKHIFIKPNSVGVPRKKADSKVKSGIGRIISQTQVQNDTKSEVTSTGNRFVVLKQPQIPQAKCLSNKISSQCSISTLTGVVSSPSNLQASRTWSAPTSLLNVSSGIPISTKATCHDVQMPVVQTLPPGSQIVNLVPQITLVQQQQQQQQTQFLQQITPVIQKELGQSIKQPTEQLTQTVQVVTQSVQQQPAPLLAQLSQPTQFFNTSCQVKAFPQTITLVSTTKGSSVISPFVTSPSGSTCPPDLLAAATRATVPHLVTEYPVNHLALDHSTSVTNETKLKRRCSKLKLITDSESACPDLVVVQTSERTEGPVIVWSGAENGSPVENTSHIIRSSMCEETSGSPVGRTVSDIGSMEDEQTSERDEDEVIPFTGHFCLKCNRVFPNKKCPEHDLSELLHVADCPILSRARASLPAGLLIYSGSLKLIGSIETQEPISAQTRFGPLIGVLKSDSVITIQSQLMWKVMTSSNKWQLLDCSDEESSNWMRFVRPAAHGTDHNLIAYQEDLHIYFMASKDIEPSTELRYWYSADYAKFIGKYKENFICPVCEKSFSSYDGMQQHKRYLHSDKTKLRYMCKVCNRAFPSSSKRKTHMMQHTGEKPHSCRLCGKAFSDQSNLRTHLAIHSDVRRFACTVCQRGFKQKAHLESHMLTHTGEKNMKCDYCGRMFARRSDLRQHTLQHTKQCVYSCEEPGCNKHFYKPSNLKKHLKVHVRDTPFTCPQCHKTFTTAYSLRRHATSHMEQPRREANSQ